MSLSTRIESLVIRVAQEFNDVRAKAGHLASLSTTDKSSLVAAINELQAAVVTATAIDDQSVASTSTYSSVKIVGLLDESDILLKVESDPQAFRSPVSQTMTAAIETLPPTASLEALQTILNRGLVAIIADDTRFHGLITRFDLLNHLRRKLS